MGTMGDSTKRRVAAAIQGGAGLGGTRAGFNPGASVGGYAGGTGGTFGKAGRGLDHALDAGGAGAAASGSPARCGTRLACITGGIVHGRGLEHTKLGLDLDACIKRINIAGRI